MSIVALDVNLKAVQIGMKSSRGVQDLNFIQGDALKLPYSDNSFDICICSLALHHFGDDSSVAVLREMHRVSAKWVLVSDLRRSWLCAALVWLVTRVLLMGRMARHDGPLSVLKARTIPEYKLLLQTAGLAGTVQSRPFWRAAIVVGKSP